MLLIRGLHNLKPELHAEEGCVATIGNFDGVHCGHQAVFSALRQRGQERQLPSLVIIFEPQPLEYFRPVQAPARLTRFREKIRAIADCGIDRVLLLKFNHFLAGMSASDFIDQILVQALNIQHLYVGDDFRFGQDRLGDFDLLKREGRRHSFKVEDLATVSHQDCRISSTRIRKHLVAGDLSAVQECLGRPYSICGRVGHGNKRGRTIGFPTINLDLHRRISPLKGVFAVTVSGVDDGPLPGVANIGTRPTVEGDDRYLLEVHLLNFDRDIYGRSVQVEFVQRIRDEQKFDSFDALRRQIEIDRATAQEILHV